MELPASPNEKLNSRRCEKPLPIKTDHKLNFNSQIDNITLIDNTHGFSSLLLNIFLLSQFRYCPCIDKLRIAKLIVIVTEKNSHDELHDKNRSAIIRQGNY